MILDGLYRIHKFASEITQAIFGNPLISTPIKVKQKVGMIKILINVKSMEFIMI